MSRTMVYVCDVCGKEIVGRTALMVAEESARIQLWGPGDPRSGSAQRYDLCRGCYEGFVTFLETRRGRQDE